MNAKVLYLILPIVVATLTVSHPVQAEEPQLDEAGTYLVEVGTGHVVHLGRGALVSWSPDGSAVAVVEIGVESPLPSLRFIQLADGAEQTVAISERGEINHLRWAPDGSRLAFTLTQMEGDPGPALMVADPVTATVREIVDGSIGELTWTPDSQGITAITLDDGGGEIVIFDPDSGDVRETVADAKDASCQRGLAWSPDGAYLAYGGPGLREGCGEAGNWGVWTWHPESRTVRQLSQGPADAPQWLETGSVVAMVSEPESDSVPPFSIVRFAPDGSETEPVAHDIPRMFPQPPRLLQVVGDTVLFPVSTCDRGEAYIWSADQHASVLQTPADVYAYRPALAPDGQSMAYVRVGEPNALVVAPLGEGSEDAPTVLATSDAGLQVGTAGPWDAGDDWSPDGRWIAIEVTSEQFTDCVS